MADFADIEAAARAAGADEFIRELPNGYDTVVGERGYTLSGGQRQRIAIARTLLVNPPVLVLDDATSAIDVQVELRIHDGLRKLLEGRTTLIIAHRLSTISLADRVLLMDGGQIVADGTHAELMATCPLYVQVLAQAEEEERELAETGAEESTRLRRPEEHDRPQPAVERGSTERPAIERGRIGRAGNQNGAATGPETDRDRPAPSPGRPRPERNGLMVMMGGGGAMFGGRGSPGNPGGGLPFAGIPSELQDGVDRLLADRAGAPRAHRHLHLRESRRRRPRS